MQTAALRNLGLNIRRAKVARKGDQITNKFYITDQKSSEKIVKSARLQVHRRGGCGDPAWSCVAPLHSLCGVPGAMPAWQLDHACSCMATESCTCSAV